MKGELLRYFNSGDWETVEITPITDEGKFKNLDVQDFIGNWSCSILNKNKGKTKKYSSNSSIKENFETELIMKEPIYIQDFRLPLFKEKRLSLNDIKYDNINFEFKANGEYEMKAGNKIIRKGKDWGLTKDKKYLYLDEQTIDENFIKITSFNNGSLKVEKLEVIDIEVENPNPCFYINLKLKLIKKDIQQ